MRIINRVVVFLFLFQFMASFCSEEQTAEPKFCYVPSIALLNQSNVFTDSQQVELFLKPEEKGDVLFLKNKREKLIPLTMPTAYYLCKEIQRVSGYPEEEWKRDWNKEGYVINFDVTTIDEENNKKTLSEWMLCCLYAGKKNQTIAQKVCEWGKRYSNIEEICSPLAPKIIPKEDFGGCVDSWGSYFNEKSPAEYLSQSFYEKSICGLVGLVYLKNDNEFNVDVKSCCSQGCQQQQNPLFFEVMTMNWEADSHKLEERKSRYVTLFLKKEDEGMVLCLHDRPRNQKESYLPLLFPAAFKLCKAIEKNQYLTDSKQFMVLDVNIRDKSVSILCDISTYEEENKAIVSEFLDWAGPFSANIHLSDSIVRSSSISIEPVSEETCINFEQNIDLSQFLFPKSLEGMPETDVLKIENFQLNKTIFSLNEKILELQKKYVAVQREVIDEKAEGIRVRGEILKKQQEHIEILKKRRNENIFMMLVLLAIAGLSLYKAIV